jgi:NADPH:quinone reductase-like Zn-dependent oxidoreductase
MYTIAFDNTGSPGAVLQIVNKELPIPGDKEVLVRVLAAPINPSDIYFIEGAYRIKPQLPGQTAGLEAAGIVEKAGRDAGISEGALVAFFYKNTWAEYVLVPAQELVVLPSDFPVDKAAQFSLNPFTAWGLLDMAAPVAGEWMLLTGANSALGRIIIQLAVQRDVRIIALVRDMAQAAELQSLGATLVYHLDDPRLADAIRQTTEDKGLSTALDTIGGPLLTSIIQNMAPFGRLIIYGRIKDEPAQFNNGQILYKNLTIRGFGVRAFLSGQTKAQRAEMIQQLTTIIGQPSFQLPVTETFPWREFGKALEQNSRSGRSGKTLLKFS